MSKVIAPILFVLVAIGLYFTYIGPSIAKAMEYRALREQLSDVLASSEDLLKEKDMIQGKYKSISEEDVAILERIVPNSVDSVRFLIDVKKLTADTGFVITNFDLPLRDLRVPDLEDEEKKRIGDLGVTPLMVQFEGVYTDLRPFLTAIEASIDLIDVVGMEIENISKEDEDVKLRFNVYMNTYWINQETS